MAKIKAKKSKLFKNQKRTVFALIAFSFILIYAISLVAPLVWTVFSSFKSDIAFAKDPFGWYNPKLGGFMPQNYVNTFKYIYVNPINSDRRILLVEMFVNSLVWAVGSTVVAEFTRSCCAYVVARFRHRHKWVGHIYSLVLILMLVSFPSNLQVGIEFNELCGLYDNMFMKVLSAISFSSPHFLYLYAAYVGVSHEYSEAARIDGAGQFTVMFKIIMPMIKNIFLALCVLTFILQWNDYTISYVFLPSYPVVAHGLFNIQNAPVGEATKVPNQLAACTLVIVPTLIIFIIFKDQMIGNLAIGGLKG